MAESAGRGGIGARNSGLEVKCRGERGAEAAYASSMAAPRRIKVAAS